MESANAEENDILNTTDAIIILYWLFLGGNPLPPPGPSRAVDYPQTDCGFDLSGLGCERFPPCPPCPPCGERIDPEFQVSIAFVGDKNRTLELYGIWKDLEGLGYRTPSLRIRDANGVTHVEGSVRYLDQEARHIDYHLENPPRCCADLLPIVVNCSNDGDMACFQRVDQLGRERIVNPALDDILNLYDHPHLRLTKLAEVYIHEGMHEYGPHTAGQSRDPGMDGTFGAGLLASTRMISDLWDAARRFQKGPYTGFHYEELLKTGAQELFLDAYLLNIHTLKTHVENPDIDQLLDLVHPEFEGIKFDPNGAVGRFPAEYLEALANATY